MFSSPADLLNPGNECSTARSTIRETPVPDPKPKNESYLFVSNIGTSQVRVFNPIRVLFFERGER